MLAWLKNRSSTAQTSERQLVSAGEAAHDFGAATDLSERALEQVRAAPPFAVPQGVAEVHDERVEVVGEAAGGRLVAAVLEL